MIGFCCRTAAYILVLFFWFTAGATPRTEHVFIISIDGGSPAIIEKSDMPVLKKLAKQGAYSWDAKTVVPLTLPAHTSMVTGVRTNVHRITWNSYVPSNGVVQFPTIFAAAKAKGFTTALFAAKEKFKHLDQPGTVDHFFYDSKAAVMILKSDNGDKIYKKEGILSSICVASNAADYIVREKPQLCFIHLADPDTVGHTFGWESSEQRKAMANTDRAIAMVVDSIREAGIAKKSVILISADHGGHGKGHGEGTAADLTIPWIAWGQKVKRCELREPLTNCDIAATALWLLDVEPLQKIEGSPIVDAFKVSSRDMALQKR